jgi:hypothetical protein
MGFINPSAYIKWIPDFFLAILPVSAVTFLSLFFVFEVVLGIWLLWGKWSVAAGIVSALLLVGITFLNVSEFGVLFRNIGLIAAAVALSCIDSKGQNK